MLRTNLSLLICVLVGGPGLAYGQDDEMTFEADEVEEMTFEEEEDTPGADERTVTLEESGTPRAVVLVVSSPGADPEVARRMTGALERYLLSSGVYELSDRGEFRAQLFAPGEAAALDCVTNAVCVSGLGKDLWVDVIVLGVLYRGEGGWKLESHRVDVETAEVAAYASYDDRQLDRREDRELDRIAGRIGAKLLGLRSAGAGDDGPRRRLVAMRSPLQTRLAWGAAGLALLAAGMSTYFGLQAQQFEEQLGATGLMQVDAPALIDKGEASALNANLFLGVTTVAAAGAAALFLIKPLQEVEVKPEGPTPGFDQPEPEPEPEPGFGVWGVSISPAGVVLSGGWR